MTKRIIAIAFIFVCASVAWAILGGTIFSRTYSLGAVAENRVVSTWGAPHNQAPPTASFTRAVPRKEETTENGKKIVKTVLDQVTTPLPLESSAINVALDLGHRQKGLLWYSTYKVYFSGEYRFRNTGEKEEVVDFTFKFPTAQAMYDNLTFTVDGIPVPVKNHDNASTGSIKLAPGATAQLAAGYESQGLNEWRYGLSGQDVTQVRDFTLKMRTNFKDIDFPDNTLSPSQKLETPNGWDFTWHCDLFSGLNFPGGQLPAAGSGNAVRQSGSCARAIRLPGDVFLRLLPRGIHRTGNNGRFDCYVVCRDAGDRTDSVGRQVFSQTCRAGRRIDLVVNKSASPSLDKVKLLLGRLA